MLKAIQATFASDIINHQAEGDYFSKGDLSAAELVQIYHNHYNLSLIDALKSSYGCVLRLVGEDFFTLLAKNYISKYPPNFGYLQNYGHFFAQFLADFELCKPYPYLIDVAYFERYYERCYHSENAQFLMHSAYPIIGIWQLNESSEKLSLTGQAQYVLIAKRNLEVVVSTISQLDFLTLGGENGKIT